MNPRLAPLLLAAALAAPGGLRAQPPAVPDWALPGSATHQQVPPPAGFHRPTVVLDEPIGVFQGQADVGAALVPGSAAFDAASGRYTIRSAGYNIWYTRDEFRYLWRKMSGDVSLAAGITFPDAGGYGDRKAVFVIRQSLDDDAKEVMTALHGAGLIHLAFRPEKGADIQEAYKLKTDPSKGMTRVGIEKRGDAYSLFVGLDGKQMERAGPEARLVIAAPFYVGIGFCSHQPATLDTGVLSGVVLENQAGKVR